MLTCGSECWTLSKNDGYMLRIFERRMLRMFYDPVKDNGIRRRRCNNALYNETDRVKRSK